MLTSLATVISTVSGVASVNTPAAINGIFRRAALAVEPALKVICEADVERSLLMYDACVSSHKGVIWKLLVAS